LVQNKEEEIFGNQRINVRHFIVLIVILF